MTVKFLLIFISTHTVSHISMYTIYYINSTENFVGKLKFY